LRRRIPVITHRFVGERYSDNGLPVESLSELVALRKILLETAKALWRRNNPDRERLPANFEGDFELRFYEVARGSVGVTLERYVEVEESLFDEVPQDELTEAVQLIVDSADAARGDQPLPSGMPKLVLPLFDEYGRTLDKDERFELLSPQRGSPVEYSAETRMRLSSWVESEYEDITFIVGEIRAADLDGCKFKLRLDDGSKIQGEFTPDREEMVIEALRQHETQKLRLKAIGVYDALTRKLKKLKQIEDYWLDTPEDSQYDDSAEPVWKKVVRIGASVPEEAWKGVPTDLSEKIDSFLYSAQGAEDG